MLIAKIIGVIILLTHLGCTTKNKISNDFVSPYDITKILDGVIEYSKDSNVDSYNYFRNRDTLFIASRTFINNSFCNIQSINNGYKDSNKLENKYFGLDSMFLFHHMNSSHELHVVKDNLEKSIQVIKCSEDYDDCFHSIDENVLITTPLMPTKRKDYYFLIMKIKNSMNPVLRFEILIKMKNGKKANIEYIYWGDYCLPSKSSLE